MRKPLLATSFVLALVACASPAPSEEGNASSDLTRKRTGDTPEKQEATDQKEGKKCGGPTNIRCADGYNCMLGDSAPTAAGEDDDSFGKCEKDTCAEHPDECSYAEPTSTICTPNAKVLCTCANKTHGTKTCSSDGTTFSACQDCGATPEKICTPKAKVLCTCANKTHGTKTCSSDGTGFSACEDCGE